MAVPRASSGPLVWSLVRAAATHETRDGEATAPRRDRVKEKGLVCVAQAAHEGALAQAREVQRLVGRQRVPGDEQVAKRRPSGGHPMASREGTPDGNQMAPRWLPDGSKMPHRWLSDGSQMATRWLSMLELTLRWSGWLSPSAYAADF